MKASFEKYIGNKDLSLIEAMKKIDSNARRILYIVDDGGTLLGCVSDGDIRRWIIRTCNLQSSVSEIMNRKLRYLTEEECGGQKEASDYMKKQKIDSLPVVNNEKKLVRIYFLEKKEDSRRTGESSGIPVIIMAGGKGTRLYPYTRILPKPLIPIGDVPILERIINSYYSQGFDEFYITVNYKKEMIKYYFNDLNPPYTIHYIEEDKPLGTAGGIRLIRENFDTPVIVTNCDILIDADYQRMIRHHAESGNVLTVAASLKNQTIPYGVLHIKENGIVASAEEKPQLSYFINTGMYVMDGSCKEKIPEDRFFHMTDLMAELMKEGKQVGIYPLSENSFLDMGQLEEMRHMEDQLKKREQES
ncbi:MAG: nucleotidyltransferase family protein [Bilifractor sp.]|jgi:dTDP-glucose pyrophosphorylase